MSGFEESVRSLEVLSKLPIKDRCLVRPARPHVVGRRKFFAVQLEGQLGALRMLAGFLVVVDGEIALAELFVELTRPREITGFDGLFSERSRVLAKQRHFFQHSAFSIQVDAENRLKLLVESLLIMVANSAAGIDGTGQIRRSR